MKKERKCVPTYTVEYYSAIKQKKSAGHWWCTPAILPTWEAEIKRIKVQGQKRQTVHKTLISKIIRAK
jgi:hypothetical protein